MQDKKSPGSSIGRAKLWRCLGYKFKSYLGQINRELSVFISKKRIILSARYYLA